MQFYLSTSESEITDCVIARNIFPGDSFDLPFPLDYIEANKVDVCKIRLSATDAKGLAAIQHSGLYSGIYSVNYSDSWQIDRNVAKHIFPPNISIKDANDTEENKKFIEKILNTRGWFNYGNPMYDHFIHSHEHRVALEYFSTFLKAKDNVHAWIIEAEGNPVGIFMASGKGADLNGSLYGILPEYRSRGLAKYIFMFIHNFCLEHDYATFNIDVGIANGPSQKAALSTGMRVKEVVINTYLYPLINKTLTAGHETNAKDFDEHSWLSAFSDRTTLMNQCIFQRGKQAASATILDSGPLHQAIFQGSDGKLIKSISLLTV